MAEQPAQQGRIVKGWFSFMDWVDERFPLTETFEYHMSRYWAPKNFNFWYYFGVLSMVVLVLQLVTGVWLTMNYQPSGAGAFASVEYIMRDVEYGWLLRYLHSTGASAFFIVVYLHMFRGLMYGSYRKPRELLWIIGMAIFACLMAEGFFGYLLPWGNMSYWGAQVIVSLVGAIPFVGPGSDGVGARRLPDVGHHPQPLLCTACRGAATGAGDAGVRAHRGSAPCRFEQSGWHRDQEEQRRQWHSAGWHSIPSLLHDRSRPAGHRAVSDRLLLVVFYAPEMGGYFLEKPNFEVADSLKTPEHIAPVWYYTPFYAMLRAATYPLFGVPAKFWGFVVMAGAIVLPGGAAVARSQPGQVDPLQGHGIEGHAGPVYRRFLRYSAISAPLRHRRLPP